MLSNNNCLQQVSYFSLLGLAPVSITQVNNESHPVFYQQFSVALALPEVNSLTNGSEPSSGRDPAEKESNDKKFICTYLGCGKKFKRRSTRRIHERSIHLNEKNFECQTCKKSFFHKSDLIKHTYIHSGTKPYLCLKCETSFSQSSNLYTHIKKHHHIKPVKQDNWVKR
ncbi:C2H2-type zinc finger protein [Endozoicomonas sp. YOMI1]|uniref:C2H2-type zinc finger protein n=1 Tax=Endozoicomonas sp. YOMI1 TaxID=2828739 RepID=UPI0021477F3A|nr:C2H2-type zinc finger protein [Endozoicomonas sp. YOMI1]